MKLNDLDHELNSNELARINGGLGFFQLADSGPAADNELSAGKVSISDFSMSKKLDKASPL